MSKTEYIFHSTRKTITVEEVEQLRQVISEALGYEIDPKDLTLIKVERLKDDPK